MSFMLSELSIPGISSLTLLGVATILGFYAGYLSWRIRLPMLVGYLVLGIFMGPSVLGLFDEATMEHLSFITKIALGFVAFNIGSELSISSLKELGGGLIALILCESFAAFTLVTVAIYLFTGDLPMAIIFGAVAPASAPAGTVAVIHEYGAKGSLTKALYGVVGFDDGLAVLIFGFMFSLSKSLLVGEAGGVNQSILTGLIEPLREIGLSIGAGVLIGLLFCHMVHEVRSHHYTIIHVFGAVLLACGLAIRWDLSLILTNMVIGFMLVNTRSRELVRRVTSPLGDVMPLVFLLFFCLAGAHLKVSSLATLGGLGLIYLVVRPVGLIGGARLAGMISSIEKKITKYVGFGILSQAGVAIGFALIAKKEFATLSEELELQRAAEIGAAVLTTVTASTVVYEIIGPISAKLALKKAGEIPD